MYGLPVTVLRLTNTYGPRMRVKGRAADVPRVLAPAARSRARSSRSTETGASGATSTTWTTPCGVPPRRDARRGERGRSTTSASEADEPRANSPSCSSTSIAAGTLGVDSVPGRSQGDRHRRLLGGLLGRSSGSSGGTGSRRSRMGSRGRSTTTASTARAYWDDDVSVPFLDLARGTASIARSSTPRSPRPRQWPLRPRRRASSASRRRSPSYCGVAHAVGVAVGNGRDHDRAASGRGRRRATR